MVGILELEKVMTEKAPIDETQVSTADAVKPEEKQRVPMSQAP